MLPTSDGLRYDADYPGVSRESDAILAGRGTTEIDLVCQMDKTEFPSDPVSRIILQDSRKVCPGGNSEFDYTGSAAAWKERRVEPFSPGVYAGT